MFTTFSSCVLHAPGSFFFYPWKPLLTFVSGDSYGVAYQYFRRDHSGGANTALHLVALAWTMLANFGLLFLADQYFFPTQLTVAAITGSTSRALANARFPPLPISYLTAVVWIICLMCSPAPIECSSLATALVGAAYLAGPLMTAHQLELGAAATFGAMLLLVKLLAPRLSAGGPELRLRGHKSLYFGLFALGLRLAARPWRGAWAAEAPAVNMAILLLMLGASSLAKPTVPCVLVATLLGRVAAELTAQDSLLLYCGAFAAQETARSLAPPDAPDPGRVVRPPTRVPPTYPRQILQGISHDVCRQKATLLQHQDDTRQGRAQTLGSEWSHTLYFPNLLLNSIYESLTGQKDSVLLSGEDDGDDGEGDDAQKALTGEKDKDA